jgi:glycosyltransferase involved in cell wall biosynthesis
MPGIGVDLAEYSRQDVSLEDVMRLRRELAFSEAQQFFLMVAEFDPRKRHADLIRAFASLPDQDCSLVFAGEGRTMAQVERMIISLGLARRVTFLGQRSDIKVLMSASVAVVLPSDREGLPMCIMEALCLETPVIGSDIRGIKDLLHGGCGLLVNVGDIRGFSDAMQWVLDHPTESRQIARLGRERMKYHSLDVVVAAHKELYDRALATNQVRRAP